MNAVSSAIKNCQSIILLILIPSYTSSTPAPTPAPHLQCCLTNSDASFRLCVTFSVTYRIDPAQSIDGSRSRALHLRCLKTSHRYRHSVPRPPSTIPALTSGSCCSKCGLGAVRIDKMHRDLARHTSN